jgi:hypothetical protein
LIILEINSFLLIGLCVVSGVGVGVLFFGLLYVAIKNVLIV